MQINLWLYEEISQVSIRSVGLVSNIIVIYWHLLPSSTFSVFNGVCCFLGSSFKSDITCFRLIEHEACVRLGQDIIEKIRERNKQPKGSTIYAKVRNNYTLVSSSRLAFLLNNTKRIRGRGGKSQL